MILKKRSILNRELEWEEIDQNWADLESGLSQKANTVHSHNIQAISGLQTTLDAKLNNSQRGSINGVAALDATGKVPLNQLPEISNDSGGMFFPHQSLTQDDIGKLVIKKDGVCQIPVFEDAVAGSLQQYSVTCSLSSFQTLSPPRLSITLENLPLDGEGIYLPVSIGSNSQTLYMSFYFKDIPNSSTEIAIGTNIEETVTNIYNAIRPFQVSTPAIHTSITGVNRLEIRVNCIGHYSDFDFIWNYFSSASTNSASVNISNSETSANARSGDILKPFLLIWGFYQAGMGMINNDDKQQRLKWFFDSPAFSGTTFLNGYDTTMIRYPLNYEEMMTGLCERLNTLGNVGIQEASYVGDTVYFGLNNGDYINFQLGGTDFTLFNNSFSFPHTFGGYQPAVPPHCKYPIVGLVKSVSETHCEIYTAPICKFKLTGTHEINFNNLGDLSRYCALNPEQPGHIMSLHSLLDEYSDLSILAPCMAGYVTAIDNNIQPDQYFDGALSLDMLVISAIITMTGD